MHKNFEFNLLKLTKGQKTMFVTRLKELIKQKGITKKQFCEDIQINKNLPKYWEDNSTIPNRAILKAISQYFNVSVEYLKGETDDASPINDTFDIFSIPAITPIKTKKLPVLGSIACGEPIFAEEEYQGYISVNEDINADFCLLAKGNSMINAGIKDGSIVFVKKQSTVDNGQIAVVLIEDEATLKRVYFDDINKRLVLNPCNDAYSPIIIDNEQLKTGQIRILGRAIACQFKVR